jgi:sentrin-specific protease 8
MDEVIRLRAVLGDASLTESDLLCLRPKLWIHDVIIHFYLEHLRLKYGEDDVGVVSPALAHLIGNTDSEDTAAMVVEELNACTKRVVLIPINNESAKAKGSHWSLLVFVPRTSSFYHVDSLDLNRDCGLKETRRIAKCLGANADVSFAHFAREVQTDSNDCGLYVMGNARLAVRHFLNNDGRKGFVPIATSRKGFQMTSICLARLFSSLTLLFEYKLDREVQRKLNHLETLPANRSVEGLRDKLLKMIHKVAKSQI